MRRRRNQITYKPKGRFRSGETYAVTTMDATGRETTRRGRVVLEDPTFAKQFFTVEFDDGTRLNLYKRSDGVYQDRDTKTILLTSQKAANPMRRRNKACPPGEIPVRRKSYKRKGYRRADGTRVSATRVPGSEFCIDDRGGKGKTARGAKGPRAKYPRSKSHKPWIKEEGSLGEGFLTDMTFAQQKTAVDRAFRSELRQHRGNRDAAYRSVLGKIMVLNRSAALKRKYGKEIDRIRNWTVKKYGGPGSSGPEKRRRNAGAGRRLNPEEQVATLRRLMK